MKVVLAQRLWAALHFFRCRSKRWFEIDMRCWFNFDELILVLKPIQRRRIPSSWLYLYLMLFLSHNYAIELSLWPDCRTEPVLLEWLLFVIQLLLGESDNSRLDLRQKLLYMSDTGCMILFFDPDIEVLWKHYLRLFLPIIVDTLVELSEVEFRGLIELRIFGRCDWTPQLNVVLKALASLLHFVINWLVQW